MSHTRLQALKKVARRIFLWEADLAIFPLKTSF